MDLRQVTVTQIIGTYLIHSPKGRYEKMQSRRFWGISLCLDGQITYTQNGREFVSSEGVLLLLPKGSDYTIRGDRTGNFPVINFDCLEDLGDQITVIPLQNREELLADFEAIKRLIQFEENRAQVLSIFYSMLHKITTDSTPPELRPAMQLIKSQYSDPSLTNARLAEKCHISEVYFRKLFTRHFKTSPKQYVIGIRLQRAKELLTEGGLRISEIAEACGFSGYYHFCRLFKEHTGTTPWKYRMENQLSRL